MNSISPERLKELAAEIVSVFPVETVGTYYTPFRTVKTDGFSTRVNASGKLYEHYVYRKTVLLKSGVISPSREAKVILNHTSATVRKATGE